MKNLQSLAVAVGVLGMTLPASVRATCDQANLHEGDFSGNSQHTSAPGVFTVGEAFTAYETLNTTQTQPWYPWNQAAYQYTLYVHGTCSSYVNIPIGGPMFLRQISFTGVTFAIYQDNTTVANYAIPSTFTDGALILSGVITGPGTGGGMYAEGVVDGAAPDVLGITGDATVTGGSGIGQLLCSVLTLNDFIAWLPASSPPGYKEAYDSQWKCCLTTPVEPSTWGGVKSLYR
ncbi:MAG: hypothetical protein U0167_05585 [bacterium]